MKILLTACAIFFFLRTCVAHLPLGFEPERIRQDRCSPKGSLAYRDPADEDFSFEAPFDIVTSLYAGLIPGPPLYETSKRLPQTSLFVSVRLGSNHDVDYFMYDMGNPALAQYTRNVTDPKDHPEEYYDFVAYPIVPACKNYKDFFPSIAMMGPLDTENVFGKKVFGVPSGKEPFHVPENYGVIIKPGIRGTRDIYTDRRSSFNSWFLPVGYPVRCMSNYEDPDCLVSPGAITVQDIPYDPGLDPFYFVIYDTAKWKKHSPKWKKRSHDFKDVDVVFGTTDKFLPSDWGHVASTAQFYSHGRTLGDQCKPVV